ncbi:MAG: hypothetical protein HY295_04785 [Thaumarchaeota archaeon]|nr:hypothetical protein [Nitrososphaerota archaeon]
MSKIMADERRLLKSVVIAAWIILTVFLAFILGLSAPWEKLMGHSFFASMATTHGIFATLGVIIGSATGYLGWRLLLGHLKAYRDLRILATISSVLAFLAITTGNWIYIAYRGPEGPREFFINNFPEIHEIFFEFKEFIALFTLPIAVAATFILWKYKDSLQHDQSLRNAVGMMIAVGWSVLMIAFVLGATITKLMAVS